MANLVSAKSMSRKQNNTGLKSAFYNISFECASYDDLPDEDDVVTAVLEGLEESFPNLTTDLKVRIYKNSGTQNGNT